MKKKKAIGLILILLFLLIVVVTMPTYLRFHNEMNIAKERLLAGSKIIQTNHGLIEYADSGEGYPVLVIHGAGGGYDQSIILSEVFLGNEFYRIAPSRFGFLRTPVPPNASPAAQADAFAELLDALNVQQVAVIGISAGGPSALQFALSHPDRCSALVMVSAISHSEKPMGFMGKIIHYVLFRLDFMFWLISEYFESSLISFLGVSSEIQAELTVDEKAWLSDVLIPAMHPISHRQPGMVNDANNTPFLNYQLNQITVPTLVIHTEDDGLVSFTHGEYAAKNIPNSRFITLQSGGHMLMGQHDRVRMDVIEFLTQHILTEKLQG